MLEKCTEKYCDKQHPRYAITLKNTTGVNLAYTVPINMLTNCKIPIKQAMMMFVKK